MKRYLILSVLAKKPGRNPFRPFSFIDLGHVDIILWEVGVPPERYGFFPFSKERVFLSSLFPQRGKLVISPSFSSVPTIWKAWELPGDVFLNVKTYLDGTRFKVQEGSLRYDALKFNCMHLAIHCLALAGVSVPDVPVQRVIFAKTIVPETFIQAILPDGRNSIMSHELNYREGL